MNAHMYKSRDACWFWGSDEQWEGDNRCVTLLIHWQALGPDHIFHMSATVVEVLELAPRRSNSDTGLYLVHLQPPTNTALVPPELTHWDRHSVSSIRTSKY